MRVVLRLESYCTKIKERFVSLVWVVISDQFCILLSGSLEVNIVFSGQRIHLLMIDVLMNLGEGCVSC